MESLGDGAPIRSVPLGIDRQPWGVVLWSKPLSAQHQLHRERYRPRIRPLSGGRRRSPASPARAGRRGASPRTREGPPAHPQS